MIKKYLLPLTLIYLKGMGFKSVVCKLELEMNYTVYEFLAINNNNIIIIIQFSPFLVIVFLMIILVRMQLTLKIVSSFFNRNELF